MIDAAHYNVALCILSTGLADKKRTARARTRTCSSSEESIFSINIYCVVCNAMKAVPPMEPFTRKVEERIVKTKIRRLKMANHVSERVIAFKRVQ